MRICILIFGLLFMISEISSAQCCAAGNPVNTDFNISSSSKSLTIGSSYKYSLSSDYYSNNKLNSEFNYMDRTYFGFQALDVGYQHNELSIKTLLGYYHSKNQVFENGYERPIKGLADLEINLSYNISKYVKNKLIIIPSFGMILPTGAFDVVVDGVVAPIDAQPSVGALRTKGGLLLAKSLLNNKLTLYCFNFIEFSKTIESERTKSFKYGDLLVNSMGGQYAFNKWLNPSIQLRSEYRKKAINQGVASNSTGGHTLFASIKNTVQKGSFACFASFDLPVYKNVNGIQLTNKFMISTGVSYKIKFNQLDQVKLNSKITPTDDLTEVKINVSGNCGMCKDRIEAIALNVKHITHAEYNIAEQRLQIYFKNQPDINKLTEGLKAAGHDNEYGKASDKAYNALHSCCKYTRK